MKTTKVLIGLLCILITYPACGYLMATQTLPKVDEPTKVEKPVTITYEEEEYDSRGNLLPSSLPKKFDITFWPDGTFTSSTHLAGRWEFKGRSYRWEDDSLTEYSSGAPRLVHIVENRPIRMYPLYTKYTGRFYPNSELLKSTIKKKLYKITNNEEDQIISGKSTGKCSKGKTR